MTVEVAQASQETLAALEASLLNTSGKVPLHNRFRSLFTLKALKTDEAVNIIAKGACAAITSNCLRPIFCPGFCG